MSNKNDFEPLDQAIRKMIALGKWQEDLDNYGGTWTGELQDTEDGSGDAILTFPDELVMLQGWKEGTELKLMVVGDGTGKSLYITEKK
jgi:hypothetical protein